MLLAKFAPAAINVVFTPDAIAINSTNIIVNTVLNTCSNVCDLAVIDRFCIPLKYPLITDAIATKKY